MVADRILLFINATRVSLQCLTQYEERSLKVFFLQHVGNTHLIDASTRRGVETSGRSHHHSFTFVGELFQTPTAKFFCIVNGELCYGIESSHGDGRIDTRNAVESVNQTLTSFDIFVIDIAVVLFRSIE